MIVDQRKYTETNHSIIFFSLSMISQEFRMFSLMCALFVFVYRHLYCYYLVCNYDYIPSMNLVIYRSHPTTPATDCGLYEVGRDKDYPNLCANNGKFYDPIAQDKKEKREKMPP